MDWKKEEARERGRRGGQWKEQRNLRGVLRGELNLVPLFSLSVSPPSLRRLIPICLFVSVSTCLSSSLSLSLSNFWRITPKKPGELLITRGNKANYLLLVNDTLGVTVLRGPASGLTAGQRAGSITVGFGDGEALIIIVGFFATKSQYFWSKWLKNK